MQELRREGKDKTPTAHSRFRVGRRRGNTALSNLDALRPLARSPTLCQPVLRDALSAGYTAIGGGVGAVASENVVRLLDDAGALERTVWLRVDGLDSAMVHLQTSLASAALRSRLIRTPPSGPDPSPASPTAVGRELATVVAEDAIIVVEDTTHRVGLPARVGAVLEAYARAEPGRAPRAIYLRHARLGRSLPRQADLVIDRSALSCDFVPFHELMPAVELDQDEHVDLDMSTLARLVNVVGWRAGMLLDLLDLAATGGLPRQLVWASGDARSLAQRLTRWRLEKASPQVLRALDDALRTTYWHPSLAVGRIDPDDLRPWLIPIEEGWWWLRPWWKHPLHRRLRWMRSRSATSRLPWVRVQRPPLARGDTEVSSATFATAGPTPSAAQAPEHNSDARTPEPHTIDAKLFGCFDVSLEGREVDSWSGRLGAMIFQYLLIQDSHSCGQERLIDMFWPHADPDKARNRLHVAVSSLRKDLRGVTPEPVVEFEHGAYQIRRTWDVRTDVDEFRLACRRGRELEAGGATSDALDRYEQALALYRDDLLTDAPYDEWTTHLREVLRIAHLDCIDRTASLHLMAGRYEAAILLAESLLDLDPTREDAYRLLMQCYAAQGRIQQALDQYDLCRTALRRELDLEPSAETSSMQRMLLDRRRDD